MAIWIFSFTRFWPLYSSRCLGRTLASMRRSSSIAAPETMRAGCPCAIIRFVLASGIWKRRETVTQRAAERCDLIAAVLAELTLRFFGHPHRVPLRMTTLPDAGDIMRLCRAGFTGYARRNHAGVSFGAPSHAVWQHIPN